MRIRGICIAAAAFSLAGCSSGTGMSTGSLFGSSGNSTQAAAPAAAVPTVNDATSRAFQVGSVSARAVKCGYNFDPVKLRSDFLAAEASTVAPTDLPRVQKVYDTAYNGVAKAIGSQGSYCSTEKTAEIKASLTRHLAGDYSPVPTKKVAQPTSSGWFDWDGAGESKGPAFGSGDWWEKQQDSVGG
jgi:hypothetical protein